jgi:hypothetical protein
MAFISRSNCEYELSGSVSKSSSSASLGSIGDVGGVVNWADWIDDRDGENEAFNGLDCEGAFDWFIDPEECGRTSAGDRGGVCECCESCWRMFMDVTSLV